MKAFKTIETLRALNALSVLTLIGVGAIAYYMSVGVLLSAAVSHANKF